MTFMQIRDCSQDSRGYICKRYFLLLDLVVVKGRGAVSDCREHLARPGRRHHNPWMVSNTIPLLLQLKFTDTLSFHLLPNCCLTYLKISTFGHFDTFAVKINSFSFKDKRSHSKIP